MRLVLVLSALCAASCLLGCNQDPGADNEKGDHEPAPCPECGATAPYAAGPFGVAQGAIINDFSFKGFIDAQAQNGTLDVISLSDFYNPHAGDPTYEPASPEEDDRLFPPGSPYGAGKPKPTGLMINIASVWCGPCNNEAKSLFNGLYAKYKPCGGEFLFQLAEGTSMGSPVDEALLRTWVSMYKVAYPSTFDPGKQILPLYSAGFPSSAIVDTRTMRIVDAITGLADDTFWSTFESYLDTKCLAGQ